MYWEAVVGGVSLQEGKRMDGCRLIQSDGGLRIDSLQERPITSERETKRERENARECERERE